MGLNIYIQRLPGFANHPDWDSSRYAGDREFAAMLSELPHESRNTAQLPDYEWYIRPSDFSVWRGSLKDMPCEGRFDRMLDILESDPNYWIYFGW